MQYVYSGGIQLNQINHKNFCEVEFEKRKRNQDAVFSKKMKAGKRRTYFFDVRKTRGEDFYITLTESTRRHENDGFERHKILIYKEDFNRFLNFLEDTVDYVKTNLMPDFDYEAFEHKDDDYDDEHSGQERKPYKKRSPDTPNTDDEINYNVATDEDDMTW